jgi:hypothetical protein
MASILSITNLQDGLRVRVTLSAPRSGAITFNSSRVPGTLGDVAAHAEVSSTVYDVTVGTLDLKGAAIPCWITATDGGGASTQTPVFCRFGTDDDMGTEVVKKLAAVLRANLPLINKRLAPFAPVGRDVSVVRVLTGMPEAAAHDKPIIDLQLVQAEDNYLLVPYGRVIKPRVSVMAFVFHKNDVSWRNYITALGWAVRDVLNQAAYSGGEQAPNVFTLPSGLVAGMCQTTSVELAEVFDGAKFVTSAELAWGCEIDLPVA